MSVVTLVGKALLCSLGVLLALASLSAGAAAPKRVLIIHSFVNAAPPFTTHSTAFEKTLTEELGERFDLDEISLDTARYANADMEEALVDYLKKRHAQWQPDLVVPIGSPAGVFVAQNRDRIFAPTTPIIYAGMDQRRLPPGTLQRNAAFVGESFNFGEMIEDILQVAPATTNVAVVLGASQVERYWAAAIQEEWAPFTNRLGFTWLNDAPFDQMVDRVSKLPPRSFIFLILLMRDAAGVTHNTDEALKRIHAVANAPVNSIFQHQLGLGIVGGRLYQAEQEGVESARVAVRVLRGEPATNFPPQIVGPLGPRYDWRELRRWNIGKDLLPAGSIVLFREPTLWERYKWRIVGTVLLSLLQTMLIILLLRNLLRRRRVEHALRESEERLSLAAAAGDVGIWMWDISGNQIWATENWRRMFGFTSDDVIHYETFLSRVYEKDRQQVEVAVRRALSDHTDYVSEHRVLTPDRAARWVTAHGRVFSRADGRQQRMLGASVDITARKQAEEASRDFSGKLLRAQENERARIAKELHDGLSQNLALLSVELQLFSQRLPGTPSQINARLDEFSRQTKGLSTEVHRISHDLHPAKLTQLGLAVALKGFCREVEAAHGLTLTFIASDVPRDLPQDVALCLYRVGQEAIQNVVKHSGATKATVTLDVTDNASTLAITDNGKGFEPAAGPPNGSLGLVSMRERMRSVDGELSIQSNAGEGTQIEARVPLPKLMNP